MGRGSDRPRAGVRLAVLGLAIAVAFLAVTLAGIAPSDAQRWVAGAGLAGPVVFVLAAGALGLALFPGHVTAAVAGVLFRAVRYVWSVYALHDPSGLQAGAKPSEVAAALREAVLASGTITARYRR